MKAPAPGYIHMLRNPRGRANPRPGLSVLPLKFCERGGFATFALGTHRTTNTDKYSLRPTEFLATWQTKVGPQLTFIKPYKLVRLPLSEELTASAQGPAQVNALEFFRKRLPLFLWREDLLSAAIPKIVIDAVNRGSEERRTPVRSLRRGFVVEYNSSLLLVLSNDYFNRHNWYAQFLALPLAPAGDNGPTAAAGVVSKGGERMIGLAAELQTFQFEPACDSLRVCPDFEPCTQIKQIDFQIASFFKLPWTP